MTDPPPQPPHPSRSAHADESPHPPHMDALWAMAVKDLKLLVRDKLGFFFSFIFPLIIAIFFGGVMSSGGGKDGARGIAVALVDEDGTEQSKAFAMDLGTADELSVTAAPSRERAAELVRTGTMTAAIVLPKGFGERRDSPFTGKPATIELGVDPARKAEAGMLEGLLTKYAFMGFTKSFTDPATVKRQTDLALESMRTSEDVSVADRLVFETFFASLRTFVDRVPEGTKVDGAGGNSGSDGTGGAAEFSPVKIENFPVIRKRRGPENAFAITFPQGIVWGVMGCAYGFAVSLSLERTRGTLLRLRAAPLARWGVVGGKALACFLAVCAVCVVLLLVGAVVFGVRPASGLLLVPAVISVAVCFVGVMMGLAVLGGRSDSSGNLGWAVLLVMAMLGGGMIPLFFMPGWMQTVSVVSPIRWSILALEGALWRGFTPAEMLVPCAVLCGMGVGCFLLGVRLFRWTAEE